MVIQSERNTGSTKHAGSRRTVAVMPVTPHGRFARRLPVCLAFGASRHVDYRITISALLSSGRRGIRTASNRDTAKRSIQGVGRCVVASKPRRFGRPGTEPTTLLRAVARGHDPQLVGASRGKNATAGALASRLHRVVRPISCSWCCVSAGFSNFPVSRRAVQTPNQCAVRQPPCGGHRPEISPRCSPSFVNDEATTVKRFVRNVGLGCHVRNEISKAARLRNSAYRRSAPFLWVRQLVERPRLLAWACCRNFLRSSPVTPLATAQPLNAALSRS